MKNFSFHATTQYLQAYIQSRIISLLPSYFLAFLALIRQCYLKIYTGNGSIYTVTYTSRVHHHRHCGRQKEWKVYSRRRDEARKCSLLHTHNRATRQEEEKDNDVLKGESFLLLTFLSSLFPLHSRSVIIISS